MSSTGTNESLYLEDLPVGRRFKSAEHSIDERQIKAFASAFDPQPFHLDDVAAGKSIFGGLAASGWHTAAITMRLNVTSGLPIAGGIVGLGGDPRGRRRCGRATCSTSKARSSKSFRLALVPIGARSSCEARPETTEARWCRSPRRSFWCRVGKERLEKKGATKWAR